jgi:hypothetical protein
MNRSPVRQSLEELRQSPKPGIRAVANGVTRFLETGDSSSVQALKPLEKNYALWELATAVRDTDDTDSRQVLEFVAISMLSGSTAFPVARDKYEFPSNPVQSPAEDFVANFLGPYLGRVGIASSGNQPNDLHLLEMARQHGVAGSRLAAFLLSAGSHQLKFGWQEAHSTDQYMGWGANIANTQEVPPASDMGWGLLDRAVWELDDDALVGLLRRQTDAPRWRYGTFTYWFARLHGSLAALRPGVIERFLSEATDEQVATVCWFHVVQATARFDRQLVQRSAALPELERLLLLVLMDSLRSGSCTAEALELVFRDHLIPEESGLCYLRDQHLERLPDYLLRACEVPHKLAELTFNTIQRSFQALVKRWEAGGKEVVLKIASQKLVPAASYSNGKGSIQAFAFEGVLDADPSPSPEELRELLAVLERTTENSQLESKEKLETRRYYLAAAVSKRPAAFAEPLWRLLEDKSKILRCLAIEGLSKLPIDDVRAGAIELLSSKKADTRASAADLLAKTEDRAAFQALNEALATESSDKVRASIHSALKACSGSPTDDPVPATGAGSSVRAGIEASSANRKLPKTAVSGLSQLPPLFCTDEAILSQSAVIFLIAKQSKHKTLDAAPDILPLLAHIDREKSPPFALALVEGFLNSEQAASDRWALALGGLLGDKRIIPPLLSRIPDWCENSRHKLAEYAAQAIALLPGNEPLMVLDSLSNRYRSKFKNVGKACAEAFNAAAAARGITADELGDMVVPDFGFDGDGIRRFEWDGGGASAELGADFKLSWFDPDTDKAWKSLPANAPAAVKDEVKTLGKLLREAVKAQTARLEMTLVRQRRWPVTRLRELFENHPLLRSFASSLVWGIYDVSGTLLRTFRRYPNGLLANAAGELEELPESDTMIGMVHPLELETAALDAWRAHLGRFKVKQPFPQIDRPVELMDPLHGNRREIALTKGGKVSAGTFRSRSEKRGWTRGSVVDAGGISSYYKLYPGAGVEVVLPTDNFYIGIDPMETVELGAAFFAKAGSVERGSYTYDEPAPDDPRVLRFDQVPAVVWSETMSDLKAVLG